LNEVVDRESATASSCGSASTHEPAGTPAIDAQHPWIGLASFTEETRGFFYGREEEVGELGRRVQRKLLTILFGQSGLGKTSILRAGIVPRLRPEGYCPVYVRIDYSPNTPPPSEQIKQAIFRATEATGTWTKPGSAVEGESLWEFLHHRDDILCDAQGRTIIPLLIFDQFEEIFTIAQSDDASRKRAAEFVADLADLVENRPPRALEEQIETDDTLTDRFDFGRADYRILIALREDYLAHLESFKGVMPSITQNRMRLARMTGQQALAAVIKPGGRLVSQEVAESIVRFVAGGSELPNAEVEPSLLSLICRELNNARIAQGRAEISADLLAGSRDAIFTEFYERAVGDQPAEVRRFIEDEMLTESGFRESLAEERVLKAFAAAGAAPDTLATLVNRRLLRIEERLDLRRVELTHDVLCPVVQASRDLRKEREARDEAERQLAAQRAREEATRKALIRARQVAAGAALLALIAIVGAVFGWVSSERAQKAEAKALGTRQLAEAARAESEKLIVYLLDDFARELEPVGRLDIVRSLTERALDYYKGLPPDLRTPDTERNRALALLRFGAIARREANFDEGIKALAESEQVFRRLRTQGDSSEPTLLGLALSQHYQGQILIVQLKRPEALAKSSAALAELGPLLARTDKPSVPLLRAQGEILQGLGFTLINNDKAEEASQRLAESQRAFAQLGAPDIRNLAATAQYVYSGAWLGNALASAERYDEAKVRLEETVKYADDVLFAMPAHAIAMYAKALSLGRLSETELFDLNLERALRFSREDEVVQEQMVKTASTNSGTWNNLGVARGLVSSALWEMGRMTESRDKIAAAAGIREQMPKIGSFQGNNLAFWFGVVAVAEAELGNPQAAAGALAESRSTYERYTASTASPTEKSINTSWIEGMQTWVHLAGGDWIKAVNNAATVLEKLQAVTPEQTDDEKWINRISLRQNQAQSLALLQLGSPAEAEKAARRALAYWEKIPRREDWGTERDGANYRVLLAETVARQVRLDEARQILAPALQFHREKYAQKPEAKMQHFEYAYALYVAALTEPARKAELLAEANRVIRSLPESMSDYVFLQRLKTSIAQAG
jgi:tetratricopeptide (TPR) repeat protein